MVPMSILFATNGWTDDVTGGAVMAPLLSRNIFLPESLYLQFPSSSSVCY